MNYTTYFRITHPEEFQFRVDFVANFLGRCNSKTVSRNLDACFEMDDGDAVLVALSRRVQKHPESRTAARFLEFFGWQSHADCLERYARVPTAEIPRLARILREELPKWSQWRREQKEWPKVALTFEQWLDQSGRLTDLYSGERHGGAWFDPRPNPR